MKFQIIGGRLFIRIGDSEHFYPNNETGYRLMSLAFCESKGLL
ncbi:hypothetical protein ACROQ8_002434 [Yersinia enterocolitica]|uniref:Uncharacterized protein n=1 Tax=Yersinia enterocolitica TaxID=630 RepID=A0A9P1PXN6_YEREN|nr:hypothetical protein [Yersinia enterocolitica]CNG11067.1 Uncharacterised protein [Yersinia enterocolitica]CQD57623.1 Uncharacterised protein [Yersinia enterocolitica]CQJ65848.1 Uncharacterised protein [Yersinia enterocolitica]